MGNRTARHQKAGDKNLKGKKSKSFCPCCDEVINHKEKVLIKELQKQMLQMLGQEQRQSEV